MGRVSQGAGQGGRSLGVQVGAKGYMVSSSRTHFAVDGWEGRGGGGEPKRCGVFVLSPIVPFLLSLVGCAFCVEVPLRMFLCLVESVLIL